MGILANSEDSGEMPHDATFHKCLHCLQGLKQSSGTEIHHFIFFFLKKKTNNPFKYKNGQFNTYCVNMYEIIQQKGKG